MFDYKIIWGYLEKISLAIWGVNIMDLMALTDINFFEGLDANLQTAFAIVGFLYLLIQLPFKIIELNQKRKSNKLENEIKEEDLKLKKKRQKELQRINDSFEAFDEVHKKNKV